MTDTPKPLTEEVNPVERYEMVRDSYDQRTMSPHSSGCWVKYGSHIHVVNQLRERAERAEQDRDALRDALVKMRDTAVRRGGGGATPPWSSLVSPEAEAALARSGGGRG